MTRLTRGTGPGPAAPVNGSGAVGNESVNGSGDGPAGRRAGMGVLSSEVAYRGDRFPADSENTPHNARLLVTAALADWRLLPVLDDAVLCANELVINAVRHGACARHARPERRMVSVSLRCRGWWALVIEVGDTDPCLPRRGDVMDESALGGRGLGIVDALADELWWARSARGGKLVFARFDLTRYGGGTPA